MSKICPETGCVVLYSDCLECDDKGKCRRKQNEKSEGENQNGSRDGNIGEKY